MANVLATVSSQKAIAGAAGAVGIQLTAPILSKIPGIGTPGGRMLVGALIAWGGATMLDGYAEAFVVGVGAGLAAQGLFALALPQLVSA